MTRCDTLRKNKPLQNKGFMVVVTRCDWL